MIIDLDTKLNNILSNLEETPTEPLLFKKFLELYPEDWKKLKITFSKFNRSKKFGKTIPLPKPEQSLKKEIRSWLKRQEL